MTSISIQYTNVSRPNAKAMTDYFEGLGAVKVTCQEDNAHKSFEKIVEIVLLIAGTWAAERFILDPLADRAKEWLQAAASLEGKSFKVSIRCQNGAMKELETCRVSSPLIIRELWRILKSASDLLATAPPEIEITRVLLVPHKVSTPLIIGYCQSRPIYLLDIASKQIKPIQSTIQSENLEEQVWEITILAERLDYLRLLPEHNYSDIAVAEADLDAAVARFTNQA